MNYLGHIFFSNNDLELMYANLLGDFVKGNSWLSYPQPIKNGILLHRVIDHYIDQHPVVLELKKSLYTELPKVAGIAIDLYFDHILARRWDEFHPIPLSDFLATFYAYEPIEKDCFPDNYNAFLTQLKQMKWISYYPTYEGLHRLCNGLSTKLSFPNQLSQAPLVYSAHQTKINAAFEAYMLDASAYFKQFFMNNLK